jgi:hypothetical protein
VLNSTNS